MEKYFSGFPFVFKYFLPSTSRADSRGFPQVLSLGGQSSEHHVLTRTRFHFPLSCWLWRQLCISHTWMILPPEKWSTTSGRSRSSMRGWYTSPSDKVRKVLGAGGRERQWASRCLFPSKEAVSFGDGLSPLAAKDPEHIQELWCIVIVVSLQCFPSPQDFGEKFRP